MIHYINEMKYKYHIFILIDAKKAPDKIQHPLKMKESLLFVTTWIKLVGVMQSDITKTKTHKVDS